jgi:hypothetical protein
MTSSSKKIRNILLLSALLLFAVPFFVLAQSSVSFSVSPTIFDMNANPAQTWQSTIRIINVNPYELALYTEVVNFRPKGESGTPEFLRNSDTLDPSSDLSSWIQTDQEIIIPAEQTIELPLKISVPDNAQPGGHYAAILIGTKPPEKAGEPAAVMTSQIISSLLFVRVSGDVSESATIRSFRSSKYFIDRPETTFEVRVENKGNVYIQPQGEIKIKNMWGQERGTVVVNNQKLFGNVLSNSVRKYAFEWKGDWSIADIGRYTAEVTLAYGLEEKQFMHADTAFWVFPWKIVLVIVLVLLGVFKLFSWAIRAYIKRVLEMSGVQTYDHSPTLSKRRRLSMSAPLEAGMLDLRKRLDKSNSAMKKILEFTSFVRTYWKFFVTAVIALIFVSTVIWYFKSVLSPVVQDSVVNDSAVTASTSSDNQQLSATSTEESRQSDDVNATVGLPVIKVVSPVEEKVALETVVALLAQNGIEVTETTDETSSVAERTVIVFSPNVTEKALAISKILNNAPLSALPAGEQNQTPEITVYIGNDLAALAE